MGIKVSGCHLVPVISRTRVTRSSGQGPGGARPRSGAGGVLEAAGREPDDLAARSRGRGSAGYSVVSGRPMFPGYPVRAVPLAAFIPSRDPGRGRGAWGGSASEGRSGGANQIGAPPRGRGGQNSLRPRAWRVFAAAQDVHEGDARDEDAGG